MLTDLVRTLDAGRMRLREAGKSLLGPSWGEGPPVVMVKGWVSMLARERGKIVPGSRRQGSNVWTNTGREHCSQLLGYSAALTPYRNDRIAYIGIGTGMQVEHAGVASLLTPVEYAAGQFLAPVDTPPDFPLSPTRTSIRFRRVFSESELTLLPGSTLAVSECGLFTDGDPGSSFAPGTRDTAFGAGGATARLQAPNAYYSGEPFLKTDGLELELEWEIRF